MDKETFKVAKEILEKYAPHQLHSMTSQHFVSEYDCKFFLVHNVSVLNLD